VALLAPVALLLATAAEAGSIRFFGNGRDDIDRVKIRIDDPSNSLPGPPADVGATDFTIEFWIKGSTADNTNTVRCGSGVYGWIDGNIVLDRDRFNLPRAFGLALGNGSVAFGANVDNVNIATHCGTRNVLDGQWHHVAVTRSLLAGEIRLFVDGTADGAPTGGVAGNLSYPDNGQPDPGNNCGTGPCINSDPFIVIGTEKHDAFPGRLAFNGSIDELRLSTNLRYTANFAVPTGPFSPGVAATAALYHFDGPASGNCTTGTVIVDAAGGASPGECRFGGSPGGPVWSSDSPFAPSGGAGTLQFSTANVAAAEGTSTVTLTVTRSGGSTGAVSVNYASADGSAIANNDYTPVGATLNWADGDAAAQTFTIPILDDAVVESSENFTVTLSAPSGATPGTPSTATITIADNDSPGTLQLSSAAYAASEGTPTRSITVTRTNGSAGAVTVNYATTDGTAIAPGDYVAAVNSLSWNAGDSAAKTFDIPIVDDAMADANETFTVAISSPSGGAMLGTPATATVTISDNDSAGGGGGGTSGGGGGAVDLVLIAMALAGCLLELRRQQGVHA